VTLAKLTGIARPPGLQRAIAEQRQHVGSAKCERFRLASGAEVDWGKVVAHLVCVVASDDCVFLAELAVRVEPPALHATLVEQRTRERSARVNTHSGDVGTEIDWGKIVAHLTDCNTSLCRVAVAQLSVIVGAPALDHAIREKGAGVVISGCDRNRDIACAKVDWRKVVTHLDSTIAPTA
jgi:hypothetical protein